MFKTFQMVFSDVSRPLASCIGFMFRNMCKFGVIEKYLFINNHLFFQFIFPSHTGISHIKYLALPYSMNVVMNLCYECLENL